MPSVGATLRPRTRAAWRAWLDRNAGAREIFLLLAKKHVPGRWLTYEEAIEEALCVGWVDGLVKRFDDDFRAIRFTPRKKDSVWSEPNTRRVRKLLREGRMTEAGLALVRHAKRSGAWAAARRREDTSRVPPDLSRALAAHPAARAYFRTLPPSYRKLVLYWIGDAKRPETRARRLGELVSDCARGRRKF
ncbi:MAG TPA: YdeI/OmpD-associated family protein [Anaeromyxobacter sp.]|nr:YdeI/OmpD-associated family protein [Anaeromyxobacter sp.]